MSIFVLCWMISLSTFWLQTLSRYHIYLYSHNHSFPSWWTLGSNAPMVYLQCTIFNTLSYWGVYHEYSHPVMTLSVPHKLNWSLAHTQTPSPAKVSTHTVFLARCPSWIHIVHSVHTFPFYYQLIFYFSESVPYSMYIPFHGLLNKFFYYCATILIFQLSWLRFNL